MIPHRFVDLHTHKRNRSGAFGAGTHCAAAPGCILPDRDDARKAGRLARNEGRKPFPPSFVSVAWRTYGSPTFCRYRVCHRVPTASPPMGLWTGAVGAGGIVLIAALYKRVTVIELSILRYSTPISLDRGLEYF